LTVRRLGFLGRVFSGLALLGRSAAALTGSDPFDSATAIAAAARCEPCPDPCFGPPGSTILITGMVVIAVLSVAYSLIFALRATPASGRFDPFAKPSTKGRYLRISTVHWINRKVGKGEGFRTPAPGRRGVRVAGPAFESLPRRKPRGGRALVGRARPMGI
jgi:hypothetical protein